MNVYRFNIDKKIKDQNFFQNGSILLLGKFDIFHIGHNELLKEARLSQNQNNKIKIGIFILEQTNNNFQTFSNRLDNLFELKFDFVIQATFDEKFKNIEGDDFIKYLDSNFNVKNYIVGSDFKFGKNRKFSANDIEQISLSNVKIKEEIKYQNTKVSASTIKRMHEFGEYNLIKKLVVNPLVFDVKISNNKIKWNDLSTIPHYGIYFFKILIDNFWYSGIIKFSIDKNIDFYLVNWNKEEKIFDQDSKIKILDIERVITNQRYDLINENDIEKAKNYFST